MTTPENRDSVPLTVKGDDVRKAIQMLASLGYEVSMNGYKCIYKGNSHWIWSKIG